MSKRRKPTAPAATGPTPMRRRAYEGAVMNRLTADWVTASTSADAEIDGSLVRLRNRTRQLCRDNAYARQALRAIGLNIIGQGIRMQARVPGIGGTSDQRASAAIEQLWRRWTRHDYCHCAGRLAFEEIARLAVQAMAESGDVFIRLVPQAFGRSPVPLGLEVLEADLVDEGKTEGPDRDGNEWRLGVRVNRWGRPIAYRFRTRHPGDVAGSVGYAFVDVPAEEVIHLAIIDRPGQTRGVPWFAAAIKRLHHLAGYEEAEVVRARASSSLMGFIQSPDGELIGDGVMDADRVSTFEPGVFKYLAPGESVQVPQLDAPDGQFEPFLRAMLRAVAASIGCSYETVSRDFSQSNYSSSRLSLLEDREHWRMLQQHVIDHLYWPVFERWMDAAIGSGALQLPGGMPPSELYHRIIQWYPRGWSWVDPAREIAAYQAAVRCGFTTQAQVVAEQGHDLSDLLDARANEVRRAEQLGLQFDTNPADDREGGSPRSTPDRPDEPESPDDDDEDDDTEEQS